MHSVPSLKDALTVTMPEGSAMFFKAVPSFKMVPVGSICSEYREEQ